MNNTYNSFININNHEEILFSFDKIQNFSACTTVSPFEEKELNTKSLSIHNYIPDKT